MALYWYNQRKVLSEIPIGSMTLSIDNQDYPMPMEKSKSARN